MRPLVCRTRVGRTPEKYSVYIIWNSCNFILGGGGYGTHTGRRSEKRGESCHRGRRERELERERARKRSLSSSLRRCSDGRAARRRRRVGVVLCVRGAWGFFGRPDRPWRQYSPGPRAAVTADRDTQSTAPRRPERSRHTSTWVVCSKAVRGRAKNRYDWPQQTKREFIMRARVDMIINNIIILSCVRSRYNASIRCTRFTNRYIQFIAIIGSILYYTKLINSPADGYERCIIIRRCQEAWLKTSVESFAR